MPNYYDRTRPNRTRESELWMIQFRSRTFFETPDHLKGWMMEDERCEWQREQNMKFIHFESVAVVEFQALVRGMLTRRKVHFALLSGDDDALGRVMGW
jgi:hypothetical protein